jgi:hypothetical protein
MQPIILGAALLESGRGGIAQVARLTAKTLLAAGYDLAMVSLLDDRQHSIESRRAWTARGSKVAFAARCVMLKRLDNAASSMIRSELLEPIHVCGLSSALTLCGCMASKFGMECNRRHKLGSALPSFASRIQISPSISTAKCMILNSRRRFAGLRPRRTFGHPVGRNSAVRLPV